MLILKALLFVNFVFLTIFIGYHFLFLILYFHCRRTTSLQKQALPSTNPMRFAIVVPAHNEATIIDRLLDSIVNLDYPKDMFDLLVIADNCTDETESIVAARGFQCYPRQDQVNLGKPHALNWFFQQIDLSRYDAVTIIDADTELDSLYLKALSVKFLQGAEVVQGYFGIMNPDDSWLTRLMVIPGVLKFGTRYFIKDKLGISCPLMGNGMGFAIHIIQRYGWNAFSVTENWEYYVMLSLQGHVVRYDFNAVIFSHAVTALSHGETQRKRWFKGRLSILKSYWFPLIECAIKRHGTSCLDTLIELASPSYSMLFIWAIISMFMALSMSYSGILPWIWNFWAALLLGLLIILFISGLIISKAARTTWLQLFYLPVFLVWKIFVTVKGMLSYRDKSWQKTERKID